MKKFLTTTSLILILSLPSIAGQFEIPEENLHISSRVAPCARLMFDEGKFVVDLKSVHHKIDSADISGLPTDLKEAQLKAFFSAGGYLQLHPLGDDYSLKAYTRGLGGSLVWDVVKKVFMGTKTLNDGIYCPGDRDNLLAGLNDYVRRFEAQQKAAEARELRRIADRVRGGDRSLLSEIRSKR